MVVLAGDTGWRVGERWGCGGGWGNEIARSQVCDVHRAGIGAPEANFEGCGSEGAGGGVGIVNSYRSTESRVSLVK